MKTKCVRPILVETKEKSRICHLTAKGKEFNDLRFLDIAIPIILDSINYELILISLEDEEIGEGDWYCYLSYKGDYKLKQYNEEKHFNEDPCITLANLKAKKVIARQSQISPEYISKFIEQYNNGNVEDLEIEMEFTRQLLAHNNILEGEEPKLTNGFVIIVKKEPINYTEEEVKHLLLKCQSEVLYPETHYEPCNSDEDNEKIFLSEFSEWFEQNKKK